MNVTIPKNNPINNKQILYFLTALILLNIAIPLISNKNYIVDTK